MDIQRLEEEILSAIANQSSLNALADLIALLDDIQDSNEKSTAIYALYRVFVSLIHAGRFSPTPAHDHAAKAVKIWLSDRLTSYIDFLGSLLQDDDDEKKKTLKISALQIMFSLLKHLSTSLSSQQPKIDLTFFRRIISSLLLCNPRSHSSRRKKPEHSLIDPDVLDYFHETWFSVYDDLRWFVLRESATLMMKHDSSEYPNLALNVLAILERLTTFPTEPNELNSWWITEFASKPPKPKKKKKKSDEDAASSDDDGDEDGETEEVVEQDQGDEDDWRKFFQEEEQNNSSNLHHDRAKKYPGVRLHKMSVHQSLHSLSSHRAVFTRAWLTLLPRLSSAAGGGGGEVEVEKKSKSKANATRVLNVMHRGVMPHFTRPILLMDWITSCVDFGGSIGLLGLNALFILIREHNLDYPSFYTRLYAFLDRDVLHLKHRARFFRLTELFLSSTHLPANLLASFVKRLSRLSLTAPPAAVVMVVPFVYNILKRHPALMVMIHREEEVDGDYASDPFEMSERDPMKTRAIESSLWELLSHSTHYHAGVVTLVGIFQEAFRKPGFGMEDFLDHTYHTIIETELGRRMKREPALAVSFEGSGRDGGQCEDSLVWVDYGW